MNQYRKNLTRTEGTELNKTGSHEVRGSIPLGSTNFPNMICKALAVLVQSVLGERRRFHS
jgi:hypothetical protein